MLDHDPSRPALMENPRMGQPQPLNPLAPYPEGTVPSEMSHLGPLPPYYFLPWGSPMAGTAMGTPRWNQVGRPPVSSQAGPTTTTTPTEVQMDADDTPSTDKLLAGPFNELDRYADLLDSGQEALAKGSDLVFSDDFGKLPADPELLMRARLIENEEEHMSSITLPYENCLANVYCNRCLKETYKSSGEQFSPNDIIRLTTKIIEAPSNTTPMMNVYCAKINYQPAIGGCS